MTDAAQDDREPREVPADDAGALADDSPSGDEDRHYQQDPQGLLDKARDSDERAQDDLLEIDQTELEELGLVLDDPHQPEPE